MLEGGVGLGGEEAASVVNKEWASSVFCHCSIDGHKLNKLFSEEPGHLVRELTPARFRSHTASGRLWQSWRGAFSGGAPKVSHPSSKL